MRRLCLLRLRWRADLRRQDRGIVEWQDRAPSKGRRSDAVAKFVLDPFEVLEVEVWPMFEVEHLSKDEKKTFVDAAEYAVYALALDGSKFKAVLNEGAIPPAELIELPESFRGQLSPMIFMLTVSIQMCASLVVHRRSPAWLVQYRSEWSKSKSNHVARPVKAS